MNTIRREQERQRAMNPVTLARLEANGSRLDLKHGITCVFYVFENVGIECLRASAGRRGFTETAEPLERVHEGQKYWGLEFTIHVIPTEHSIGEITDGAVELAAECNAEFDGWYAEVRED